MRMTLSARAIDAASGMGSVPVPPPLTLDRRGASIGRAPECDLVLPDPRNLISRRHCQVDFDGSGYVLSDTSTSGTQVNGQRLARPHRLAAGDTIAIGAFQVSVAMPDSAARSAIPSAAPAPGNDAVTHLLTAAGIPRAAVPVPDAAVLMASGQLLRQLVTAMVALLAAPTRARTELRVPADTSAARNPYLAAAAPEAILAELLRGGAPYAGSATDAATALIETHQRAILGAMQGALGKTLDALSPTAIRARTKGSDAALWQAYESAFAGQAEASDFLTIFARELAAAYARLAASPGDPANATTQAARQG